MTDAIRYLILGLGPGALYALLALGIVLVYRGSGVVNFASGTFALFGAATFMKCRDVLGGAGAVVVAIVLTALLALAVQFLVMREMRLSSPLTRMVATLGVAASIQVGAELHFGPLPELVDPIVPAQPVKFFDITVGADRFWILGITAILSAALWITYRFTLFGHATTAVAEDEQSAALRGWSPNLVAAVNWSLAGALGGLAGVLLIPIVSFSPGVLTLTVVPALAAAVMGGFRSFPLTLAGGVILGIWESWGTLIAIRHPGHVLGFIPTTGLNSAGPLIIIILLLIIRPERTLPSRGHAVDRLPRVGAGVPPWPLIAVGTVLAVASILLFTDSWTTAFIASATTGILLLSVVVVTGYAGQLSLAQSALAGIGALAASRLAYVWDLPFFAVLPIGVIAAVLVGTVVALPAIRTRGINLAVATLALAVVIERSVLTDRSLIGDPLTGTVVSKPHLFSLDISAETHPQRYALLVLAMLAMAAFVVSNLRRGRAGRRLISVRSNERAAASLGVNVVAAKLYAFAVGSGLAGLSGVLLAFQFHSVFFTNYGSYQSIQLVLLSAIGGIGFVGGAFVGGVSNAGGLAQDVVAHWFGVGLWILLITSLLTIFVVVQSPEGIAAQLADLPSLVRRGLRRAPKDGAAQAAPAPHGAASPVRSQTDISSRPPEVHRVAPKRLEVRDLHVAFGGMVAVDGLTIAVEPGQIVGLIGPNGAGKTTVVDAVTGFNRRYRGDVVLDGKSLGGRSASARARAGIVRSFQSVELFEDLTVGDNLRVAGDERRAWPYVRDLVLPRKQEHAGAAAAAIDEFELRELLDHHPGQLGYAQRRAIGIARAVAVAPSVLLLDEPASGIDDVAREELIDLMRRLADDWGMGLLLIEHDMSLVARSCDTVVVMDFGRQIAAGSPEQVLRDERVIAAYLGSSVHHRETLSAAADGLV